LFDPPESKPNDFLERESAKAAAFCTTYSAYFLKASLYPSFKATAIPLIV